MAVHSSDNPNAGALRLVNSAWCEIVTPILFLRMTIRTQEDWYEMLGWNASTESMASHEDPMSSTRTLVIKCVPDDVVFGYIEDEIRTNGHRLSRLRRLEFNSYELEIAILAFVCGKPLEERRHTADSIRSMLRSVAYLLDAPQIAIIPGFFPVIHQPYGVYQVRL